MYVIPKSMSLKATKPYYQGENNKPGQFSEPPVPFYLSLRNWLLFWASLRLAVSVLWTGVLVIMTCQAIKYYWYQWQATNITEDPYVLPFGVIAIALQLIEFGMIITFIVAGIKKSASLYRVYYRYCILTLIIYIVAVFLCFTLEDGYYFGEIYLTYHINDLPTAYDDGFVFGFAAILDICLEVLLINLITKLINKYSYIENTATCEKV